MYDLYLFITRVLKDLFQFDQCDVTNMQHAERLFRELQTLEYGVQQQKRAEESLAAKSSTDALLSEEAQIMRGVFREHGDYMASPELIEHCGAELLKNIQRQKGTAKLRDLQSLRAHKK